jgi:diguanylate cyclase (GGDEF)-like protein
MLPATARLLLVQTTVFVLWLLAFGAARLLEYAPHASLWFPPVAISFGGFVALGWRALPPLFLACLAGTLLADLDYQLQLPPAALAASGLGFALGHCLPFWLLATLLRRVAHGEPRATLRLVSAFLLGGGAAALLSAFGGVAGLSLGGMLARGEEAALLVPWLIGDYAGLVALGPLAAVLLSRLAGPLRHPAWLTRRHDDGIEDDRGRGGRAFAGKLTLLLGLTVLVMLLAGRWPDQPPLVFVLFFALVVQLWIVHTQSPLQTLLAIAAFSVTLALLTALLPLGPHALTLQFAMITLAANSYFGLAVPGLYADNARLRRLLARDPLTGAWSRSSFEQHASAGIEAARGQSTAVTLVMLDLDLLKSINDAAGHAAGDRALRLLVEHCRRCLRPDDVIGRLSGDEFCLYLPGTDAECAARLVQRIQQALAQASPPHATASAPPIQASFGIATLDPEHDSYPGLLARADQAMYRAKRESRGGDPMVPDPPPP